MINVQLRNAETQNAKAKHAERAFQMNSVQGKIKSLQALRAMAFLGIFFAHADFIISWSALGVSIFYVLSGFLMMHNHGNQGMDLSVRGSLRFSVNKIKKLYPLHIITMVFFIILSTALFLAHGDGITAYIGLLGKIVLNVFLLQSWVPHVSVNISLNGVAWYLSTAFFLYFMFPHIASWIRRKKDKFLLIFCFAILCAEIVSCIPWIYFLGESSFVYIWFMYFFPVFRLGDFFIGCCLGRIYRQKESDGKGTVLKYTLMEIAATAVTVGVFCWLGQDHRNSIILTAFHNWTTLYVPLAVIWVYLFAENKGIITILLSGRLFVNLGNISGPVFLIHYVVVLYTNNMLNFFDINLSKWQQMGAIVLELGASILASLFYIAIEKRLRERIKQKKRDRINKPE